MDRTIKIITVCGQCRYWWYTEESPRLKKKVREWTDEKGRKITEYVVDPPDSTPEKRKWICMNDSSPHFKEKRELMEEGCRCYKNYWDMEWKSDE